MENYYDYLFFIAIGTIIGIIIQFFIIRYATLSNENINYQRINQMLLKLIAEKLGATDEDFNEIKNKL